MISVRYAVPAPKASSTVSSDNLANLECLFFLNVKYERGRNGRNIAKWATLSAGSPKTVFENWGSASPCMKHNNATPVRYRQKSSGIMMFFTFIGLQRLHVVKSLVISVKGYELVMSAPFHYASLMHHADLVGILDGRQAMGDSNRGS